MKNTNSNRIYSNQKQKVGFDETLILGGLTILIFAFIAFRFIYPLITQGLLF